MEQKEFSALQVIQDMIDRTKSQYSDNGFLYLFWGYLVLFAAAGHYALLKIEFESSYLPWAILMPIGGIFSFVYGLKEGQKQQQVKSYVDDLMKYIWISFGAVMAVVLIRMPILQLNTYPIIMLFYGIPTFITGGIFKFKPLIIGGILCWVFGFISFQMSFDNQLLWLIASIISAYIVPGHILKHQYKTR